MEYLNKFYHSTLDALGDKLPGVLGALLLLAVGLFIAKSIRKLIHKGLKKSGIGRAIDKDDSMKLNIEALVSKLIYYALVILLLISVLSLLGVSDVLQPVKDMMSEFLGFIPNILAGGIIGYAGYLIAKIVSELMGVLGGSLDKLSTKIGLKSEISLLKIVKQVVFLLVFIPILITALNALKMDTIAQPATEMLHSVLNSVPLILAAAVILIVFFIGGKFISSALTELLASLKADDMPEKFGFKKIVGEKSLSQIIGRVIFFYICFFGIISAFEKLEMLQVVEVLRDMLELSGKIFFGLLILAVGSFLSNIAYKALSGSSADGVASLARIALLGLFFAMSLSSMGFAEDIVNLAFALILGAVAIAVALSFGLGGREAAGKQMEKIIEKFNKKS